MKLIAAISSNGVIGQNGQIPWRLPSDLTRFRYLTMGYPVVMGSKTYLSLPNRPLDKRKNVVLSASGLEFPSTVTATSAQEAAQEATPDGFVIGGAQVFDAMLPWVDTLFITRVYAELEGDTFWDFSPRDWNLISQDQHMHPVGGDQYPYSFEMWVRKFIA